MAFFEVLKPGPLCFVQDEGRTHCQHLGFAQGGAADRQAFCWANRLLHNPRNTAALEITLGPFVAQFSAATQLAISGAATDIQLNDRKIYAWSSFHVQAGDRLSIAQFSQGLRTYLAVRGGIKAPFLFSSCSTVVREGLGGLEGRPLVVKDRVHYSCVSVPKQIRSNLMVPFYEQPDYSKILKLRLIPSYQFEAFNQTQMLALSEQLYRVSQNSNRMGYRLEGEAIKYQGKAILSEGIAYGSVQVPPDGQPIVLLNDRQTIGGYPKMGCVYREDCYQLAQRRPGQYVQFEVLVRRC